MTDTLTKQKVLDAFDALETAFTESNSALMAMLIAETEFQNQAATHWEITLGRQRGTAAYDAFLHAYVAARTAQLAGTEVTRTFGTIREEFQRSTGQSQQDTDMDVNAGLNMHHLAGAKVHHLRSTEGPRGGLLLLWSAFGGDLVVRYVSAGSGSFPGLIEPVALAVHLQDMDVMREAIEQRAGQAF